MSMRWLNAGIVIFWAASMGWLAMTKIAPRANWRYPAGGETSMAPAVTDGPSEVSWEIRWHERAIGWAAYRLAPKPHGVQEVHSLVHFDELPVDRMVRELFGPMAGWLHADAPDSGRLGMPMEVETRTVYDPLADSQRFASTVHLGSIRNLMTLVGTVLEGRLHLEMRAREGVEGLPAGGSGVELYRGDVELPSGMSTAGLLSPLANLRNLRLGHAWTFQAYRPLPFGAPTQLARAEVEGEERMEWQSRRERVRRVVLRYVDQAQPSAAREPFGWLWVMRDGTVLKQRMQLANLSIDFLRLSEPLRRIPEPS